jgi:Holliday junction resolvase RusA-like endonuclease
MADTLILELDGNIPPKKNRPRIFKRGKTFVRIPSKAHEKWHSDASYQIKMQLNNISVPLELPIQKCEYIEVHLYYATLGVKDNTNTVESVHDLLADLGIIEDDNWKVTGETRQIPHHRKNEAGCKIIIKISE